MCRPGELFLIDSGAQYADGTTDITRTVAIGTPTDEMRDRFTRVLKGHIAIARAVFPEGTTGAQIDALARIGLWDERGHRRNRARRGGFRGNAVPHHPVVTGSAPAGGIGRTQSTRACATARRPS